MSTTPSPSADTAAWTAVDVDPAAGLRVEHDGTRATFTLCRPDRLNAQTPLLWDELTRVRAELPGSIRLIVLRGEGRAFSAGLDRGLFTAAEGILALPHLPQAEATARIGQWQRAFDFDSRPDVLTVAAVQGHAIGGGFQLALGADVRIAASDVQFCMAEPALGIVPDLGGTKRLVDLIGTSRAIEICLTARRVGADEALRLGLVSHVVAPDELDAAVERTAAAVLAVDRDAAAETKALLRGAGARTQDQQQAAEREAQYRRLRTLAGLHAED